MHANCCFILINPQDFVDQHEQHPGLLVELNLQQDFKPRDLLEANMPSNVAEEGSQSLAGCWCARKLQTAKAADRTAQS